MSKKQQTILIILGLLIACALLALILVVGYSYLEPRLNRSQGGQSGLQPVLLITSPRSGQEVVVGEPVMVHAVASGADDITRVELWIDGQLHTAKNSSLPDGTSPFPLVALWQPATAGSHTLIARAFAQGERAQAVVEVEATGREDRDSDGVPDAADACTEAPGVPSADGCPDRDGDGVPDGSDACSDESGAGGDGCPAPGDGDRDGDGVPDEEDGCPDEPGVPGEGCPLIGDRDGDGVPDDEDACPDEPGVPSADGCPDRDGDGTPDGEDACPMSPVRPKADAPYPVMVTGTVMAFPMTRTNAPMNLVSQRLGAVPTSTAMVCATASMNAPTSRVRPRTAAARWKTTLVPAAGVPETM